MLSQDVQAYLAVRRAMGFGMKWSGNLLRGFAAFSDAAGQHHVCSETAIKWAGSTPSVRTRARRLGLVIRLARTCVRRTNVTKCRLLCSAARTDRGALLTFI